MKANRKTRRQRALYMLRGKGRLLSDTKATVRPIASAAKRKTKRNMQKLSRKANRKNGRAHGK